jgi:hypothetical protein
MLCGLVALGVDRLDRKSSGTRTYVERRNQFQVREGRAILSVHNGFLDAEEAALRYWLGLKPKGDDEEFGLNLRPS